jgi:hypothetical protein
MTPVIFIALGAGAAAAIGAAAFVADRRRRAALAEYCLVRGYRLELERRGAQEALAEAFAIFRQGHSRRWRWTISGSIGNRPFTAFEYSYVTGGGNSNHRHRFAMLLWEAPDAQLPRFSVVPEGFFRRLGQRFGVKDFDFDEDPEFSRRYQLQGDEEARVRALFTPGRRTFLTAPGLDGDKPPRHHLAGAGPRLVWWRDGGLPSADQLDQFLAEGDAVRRQFLG